MTLDKVRPQTVQPMGPAYLSRRLTVVSRRDSLLRVLYFVLVAAAVLIPWIVARWIA